MMSGRTRQSTLVDRSLSLCQVNACFSATQDFSSHVMHTQQQRILQKIQADLKAVKTRVDAIGERLAGLVERLISQRERESAISDVQCELENFKAQIMPALGILSGSVGKFEQLHHPGNATSPSQAGKVMHGTAGLCMTHQFLQFLGRR
jgi:septal ring factor EnvC (AmiA/AmiB activator)